MLRLSYDDLIRACREYRAAVQDGRVMRAQWDHFAGWIGEDSGELTAFMTASDDGDGEQRGEDAKSGTRADRDEDAKKMEARGELKRLATFIRGELATSPNWGGALSAKSIFLQKQAFDGRPMADKQEISAGGDIAIKVSFGGGLDEPFG
jgi:hypothetical protein